MTQALQNVNVQDQKTLSSKQGPSYLMTPTNMAEAMKFADMIAKSDLAPRDFKNRPGNVLVAIQMGAEVGLAPMQAIQNISVINGRPSVWGDAALALVKSSGLLEYIIEEEEKEKATCRVKRRGDPNEVVRSFSQEDAEKAKLTKKDGTWQTYPKRMRQMRARAFALRDTFADVLKGLAIREEVEDYQVIESEACLTEDLMPKRKVEETKPSQEKSESKETQEVKEEPEEAPYWTVEFNDQTYVWVKVAGPLTSEFLKSLGMKERADKPGYFYAKYNEQIEEKLAIRLEEVAS